MKEAEDGWCENAYSKERGEVAVGERVSLCMCEAGGWMRRGKGERERGSK